MNKKNPYAPKSAPVPEPEPVEEVPVETEETDPYADVPAGTINQLKDWVGEDVERAALVLEREQDSEAPRATLISYLEDLLGE